MWMVKQGKSMFIFASISPIFRLVWKADTFQEQAMFGLTVVDRSFNQKCYFLLEEKLPFIFQINLDSK